MSMIAYQIQLDDLPITVKNHSIVMPHFHEAPSEFDEEIVHNMSVTGKWQSRDLRNAAEFTVKINFWDKDSTSKYSDLEFIGSFSINRYGAFEVPYLCEKIGEYCFEIINNYLIDKQIIDKNQKPYPMPKFTYDKSKWVKNYFEMPR